LNPRQREVGRSGVIPNLDAGVAKQEYLAVVYDQRNYVVGVAFGAGEVQRVNRSAIQQAGHPKLLRIRLVEYKVTVKVANRPRAGKIHIRNLPKHPRGSVVDKTCGLHAMKIWVPLSAMLTGPVPDTVPIKVAV
jgi:hypothetical protein